MEQRLDRADRTDIVTQSGSFCALAWTHLGTTVDGVWTRCCFDASKPWVDYSGPSEPVTTLADDCIGCSAGSRFAVTNPDRVLGYEAAFHSEAMNLTRRQMLAGDAVPACTYCYEQEAAGVESQRKIENRRALADETTSLIDRVAATGADGSVSWFPVQLDLRLGNLCNLKCTMCDYPTSSRWGAATGLAWANTVVDPFRDDDAFWRDLEEHAGSIRKIYLAGGEPLLSPSHFRLLDLLIGSGAAGAIRLEYNTNLTVLPEGLFARLSAFREVEMRASCDGVGATFEAIRVGASWATFVRNVGLAKRNVTVVLDVAVQRANVSELQPIIDFAVAEGVEVRFENFLAWPRGLSVRSMDEADKRMRTAALSQLVQTCRERGLASAADRLDMLCSYLAAPALPD